MRTPGLRITDLNGVSLYPWPVLLLCSADMLIGRVYGWPRRLWCISCPACGKELWSWKTKVNIFITSLLSGTSLSPGLQIFTSRRERLWFMVPRASSDALGITCQSRLTVSCVQSDNLVMPVVNNQVPSHESSVALATLPSPGLQLRMAHVKAAGQVLELPPADDGDTRVKCGICFKEAPLSAFSKSSDLPPYIHKQVCAKISYLLENKEMITNSKACIKITFSPVSGTVLRTSHS